MQAIGVVRSSVDDPSRDEFWGGVESVIELHASVLRADATRGLEEFSHVQVIYLLDRVRDEEVERGSRRPKGRAEWPEVGILAQRSKRRPNRIGLATCRLLRVDGLRLTVTDLDAIDGSPVLDVKPYMTGFSPRGEVREPKWAVELMSTYFS